MMKMKESYGLCPYLAEIERGISSKRSNSQ